MQSTRLLGVQSPHQHAVAGVFRLLQGLGAGLLSLVLLSPALAQEAGAELVGTLKKAQATGSVTIGYRDSSVPFSYASSNGTPIGYSIDLCQNLVSAIAEEVGRELTVKWVKVDSDNRIDAVKNGQVDLECGSTTNNPARRAEVAFSPVMFVAGTKLMVHQGSPIQSFRDLQGKTVVVTKGTTNEKAMRDISTKFHVNFNLIEGSDHADSFAKLMAGQADAFATDDAILYGLIAKNKAQGQLVIVGEFLSYEPYGIMYRKNDVELNALVQKSFTEMAEADDFSHIYDRWFMRRLPSGERMNMPMSPQLETIFESYSTHPD
jgi:glutamate/aspartate transport system substrate-binding protein